MVTIIDKTKTQNADPLDDVTGATVKYSIEDDRERLVGVKCSNCGDEDSTVTVTLEIDGAQYAIAACCEEFGDRITSVLFE